jgi:hypothetical protein
MKNTYKLLLAGLFCLVSSVNAATINIGGATGGRLAVLTSGGSAPTGFLTSANSYFITIGHFAADPTFNSGDAQNSFNGIVSTFIPLRSATVGNPVVTVASVTGGLLGGAFSGTNPAGLDGKQIYVLITDSLSLASATQFGVLKSPLLFPNPVSGSGTTNTSSSVAGMLQVIGSVTDSPGTDRDFVKLVQIVPEPSVALLGALGVFGLIRRRR